MAQTIKFVYEDGKVRIQNTSVDLTKETIKSIQHDYKAKYFMLTDGVFAPEKKKHYHKRPQHATSVR